VREYECFMGIQARVIGGKFLAAGLLTWLLVQPAMGELSFEPWAQYVTGDWICTGITRVEFDLDGVDRLVGDEVIDMLAVFNEWEVYDG
jgi:hypothetical protein